MSIAALTDTARQLVAGDKGLLAIDESIPTCNKRFASLGIAQTEHTRRAYRELIITTPGLAESNSGVILYDETFRQDTAAGVPFRTVLADAEILAGIKVDHGTHPLAGHPPDETVTEGLEGLRERLADYAGLGARFAKWRAVFTIGPSGPSRACVDANAHALARYAALCQEAGLVPIVEPEVLMAGTHALARCDNVTEHVLQSDPATCSRHLGRPGGQQAAGTTGVAGPGGRQSGRSPRRLHVGGDRSTRDTQ